MAKKLLQFLKIMKLSVIPNSQLKSSTLLLLLLCWSQPRVQEQPKIDLDAVKQDFLAANTDVPARYIESGNGIFTDFYLDSTAFVHLRYKRFLEASLKCTYVAVYRLSLGAWKLQKIIPYYYNMSLMNKSLGLFYSNNEFCSMGGECTYYEEVSRFRDNDFETLASCQGYDNYVFYDTHLIQFQEDPKDHLGDTIKNITRFKNLRLEKRAIKFDLEKITSVLKAVNEDSLILDNRKTDVAKFQEIIVK